MELGSQRLKFSMPMAPSSLAYFCIKFIVMWPTALTSAVSDPAAVRQYSWFAVFDEYTTMSGASCGTHPGRHLPSVSGVHSSTSRNHVGSQSRTGSLGLAESKMVSDCRCNDSWEGASFSSPAPEWQLIVVLLDRQGTPPPPSVRPIHVRRWHSTCFDAGKRLKI